MYRIIYHFKKGTRIKKLRNDRKEKIDIGY